MQARAFGKQFLEEVAADDILDVAAMMTYYAVFALFPMLVFVVTMVLLVLPSGVIEEGVTMAAQTMPPAVAQLLTEQVTRMEQAAATGFAIGGALLAVWGASRGSVALMTGLNDIFDKKETRPWWKRQLIAIATTLVVAVLIVAALALVAIGPAVGDFLADSFGYGAAFDLAFTIARWVVAAFLLMLVWAILYKWLPDTDAPFRIFTPGAAIGVLLWVGVTRGFSIYLDNFGSYEETYGTLAAVIIFMTWLWLSNLSILVGAEINDVLAELRKDRDPAAARLAEPEKAPGEKSKASPSLTPARTTP